MFAAICGLGPLPSFFTVIKLIMAVDPPISRALKVNLADYRVEVTVDPKYLVLADVMSRYFGLREGLRLFMEELCHPYKNWAFIVSEARTFSLGYFHALTGHPRGPEAAGVYMDILNDAIKKAGETRTKSEAFKTLFLYMRKVIRESGSEYPHFEPVLEAAFKRITRLPEDIFFVIVSGYYQLSGLGRDMAGLPYFREDGAPAFRSLLLRYLRVTYDYWLSEPDPAGWLKEEVGASLASQDLNIFDPVSHMRARATKESLDLIAKKMDGSPAGALRNMLDLPCFGDFVACYRSLAPKLASLDMEEKDRKRCELIFLFHVMNLKGLSIIHEDSLREINRIISWLVANEKPEDIRNLIQQTFDILAEKINEYPDTVLMCELNLGRGVYRTDRSDLVNYFNSEVVRLGFQTPDFEGISDDWQLRSNLSHIRNIRTWMELVSLNPNWSQRLLSALIIRLSINGVLIKDTDLFPRDISVFLSGDIKPVYNLVKQLARLFPAYFNEIGAEGRLRDISTRIDEVCGRRDALIHFLRKQSHVESSSQIVSFMEAILEFWRTRSKEGLRFYLPPHMYEEVDTEGPYIDGVHNVLNRFLKKSGLTRIKDLLALDEDYYSVMAAGAGEKQATDLERVAMAVTMYRLLNQKYCVDYCDLGEYLAHVRSSIPFKSKKLERALSRRDPFGKLAGLLDSLAELKDVILSDQPFEIREDIYRKRHFSVEIPSMYGTYHEPRFDAMGLSLRLEVIVNALLEEITEKAELEFITRDAFKYIHACLRLFRQALKVDGIPVKEFDRQLELLGSALKIRLFSFGQYLDIFRGFTQVLHNIVNYHFNGIHEQNLNEMADSFDTRTLLPKYRQGPAGRDDLADTVSEVFLRDVIASSLGLQRLDTFLTRILNTLYKQSEKLPVERHYLLLTYNPDKVVTSIGPPFARIADIVHLGSKGMNMLRMKSLGLRVPPGFIVTTEFFRCRDLVQDYPPAYRDFRNRVDAEITRLEKETGKIFGSPENTLLLSVRSGAAVSQPGMMDTYLNVGMNEAVVEGMIRDTGREWFVWDCYRRFLQFWGMSFGLARDDFDFIIREFKQRFGVALKKDFSPEQMKEVAMAYKAFILAKGVVIETSPREQLYSAISSVMNSWNSAKAGTYRNIIGISDDWGTSVTVQAMVYGNISGQAGAGVMFTHSPRHSPDIIRPWGDYTTGNQGDDVVSGLVATYPISAFQAEIEKRPVHQCLENSFPEIYKALNETARLLIYDRHWSPQDIEFTFEGPDRENLFLLQTRDMEMGARRHLASFEQTAGMHRSFLGHGIGVSGGAMWGRAVFTAGDISGWRSAEPETPLILVRSDTVPDDIREISLSDGLLTARGGATSHAAIVATRLGKTCVVGCTDLVCMEKKGEFTLNGRTVKSGDYISIDGQSGSIYPGAHKTTMGGET